jgi:DNA-binding response OmpR family regulator
VKALLRRSSLASEAGEQEEELIVNDQIRIDLPKRRVLLGDETVELTFVEFEILLALAGSPGRVWSRDQLLSQVWGNSDYRDPRTVDVHIRHLREKLEVDTREPNYILTVRGVGYRFREPDGS